MRLRNVLFLATSFLAILGLLQPAVVRSDAGVPQVVWQRVLDQQPLEVAVAGKRVLTLCTRKLPKEEGQRRAKWQDSLFSFRSSSGLTRWVRTWDHDRMANVVAEGRRVIVSRRRPAGLEVLNSRTGRLLWSWTEDRNRFSEAPSLLVDNGVLFTGGELAPGDPPALGSLLIQARSLNSGRLLWERWEPPSGVSEFVGDEVREMSVSESRLFVVGLLGALAGKTQQSLIRAYDVLSGDHLWERLERSDDFWPSRIHAQSDLIVVSGRRRGKGGRQSLIARGLSAVDGSDLWEFSRTEANRSYYLSGTFFKGDLALVVGHWAEGRTPFEEAVFVFALDRVTGRVVWEYEVEMGDPLPGHTVNARLAPGSLFILAEREEHEQFMHALTPRLGRFLWEIPTPHTTSSIAVQGGIHLFAAGGAVVTAYSLPPR